MLIVLCGKMGAGKSTKAAELAHARNAVLLSEDEWLEKLYPSEIRSLADYIEYAKRLKPVVKKLVQDLLIKGLTVVMDFLANTVEQRAWFKEIFSEIDASHELIYLDVSNETCLKQIELRRKTNPERNQTDTKEMFEQVTKYFVSPGPEEDFHLVRIVRDSQDTPSS